MSRKNISPKNSSGKAGTSEMEPAPLQESEAYYRELFNLSPNALFLIGNDGHFLDANRTAIERYGYSLEELRQMTPTDLAAPDLKDGAIEKLRQGQNASIQFEWRHRRKDGSELPVEIRTLPATIAGRTCNYAIVQDITERKQSEQALLRANEWLTLAQRSAGAGLWDWDQKIDRLTWSPELYRLFGIDPKGSEASFDSWRSILHPEDRARAEENIQVAMRDHRPLFSEYRILLPSGEVRWINALGDTTYDDSGKPVRMTGICFDATERKKTEEELRASEAFHLAVIDNSPIGISVREKNGRLLYANDVWKKIWALSDADMLQHTTPERTSLKFDEHDNYLYSYQDEVLRVYTRGGYLHLPELKTSSSRPGAAEWISQHFYAIQDAQGRVDRVVILTEDITARKHAEDALRESDRRFREVLENVLLLAVSLDRDGKITFANDYLLNLTGWQRDEILGANWFDIFVPPDVGAKQIFDEKLPPGEIPMHFENVILTRQGERRTIVWNNTVLRDSNGSPIGTASIGEDITERRLAEENLKQSFEQSPVPMVLVSMPDAVVRIANPASLEFLGLTDDPSYIGTRLFDFKPTYEDFDRAGNPGTVDKLPLARALMGEKTINEERYIIHKDGTIRWELASAAPICNAQGDIIAGYLVMIDITARKQAEEKIDQLNASLERRVEERTAQLKEVQEQLVRQERLATLGKLAGSVGHELRNPLGVISNAIYYLKLVQPEAAAQVREYLDILEQETRSAEQIISDLLDYSRVITADRETVPVKTLVDRAFERYPIPAAAGIRLETRIADDLPLVHVDVRQMVQVLGNLLTNAFQAMPDGGELHLAVRPSGDEVALSITDTGTGISPENMTKLFEPLFTTKPRGIGLGLAVSRKLAEANGSRIEVRSEPGKGSTFTVHLPVHKK